MMQLLLRLFMMHSKVSVLVHLPYKRTIQSIFENPTTCDLSFQAKIPKNLNLLVSQDSLFLENKYQRKKKMRNLIEAQYLKMA